MSIELINKIKEDPKLYEYLKNNSEWYTILNRNETKFNDLLKAYKEYKHNNNLKNIDNIIDNVDLISSLLKIT